MQKNRLKHLLLVLLVMTNAFTAWAQVDATARTNKLTEVQTYLGKTIGYPKSGATARTELQNLYNALNAKSEWTNDDVTSLDTKLTAFRTSTTDILFPESGRAYTFMAFGKATGNNTSDNTPYYLSGTTHSTGNILLHTESTKGAGSIVNYQFKVDLQAGQTNKFSLYNLGLGKYVNNMKYGTTPEYCTFVPRGDGKFTFQASNNSHYIVWNASAQGGVHLNRWNSYQNINHMHWTFVEIPFVALNITPNPVNARATYSWNGRTITNSGSIVYTQGETITTSMLSCTPTDTTEFKFVNFTKDGVPVTQITANDLAQSVNVTANFTHAFFSNTYGEKWIRIVMSRSANHAWRLKDGSDFANKGTATAVLNNTDERFLWCFVGNANEFKIYNKASGENFALTANNNNDGTHAVLVTANSAKSWKLAYDAGTNPGYTLNLKDATTSMSLNSYGGAAKDVRFYNATDGGGHWQVKDGVLAPAVIITPNIPGAKGLYTWNNGTIKDKGMIALSAMGAPITNAALTGRSTDDLYTFVNFTDAQGTVVDSVKTLTEPLHLTANFRPSIFSTTYGEKWVRITPARNNNYGWRLNDDNSGITSKAIDMADERFLWCLVGTNENFKIYNKVTGESHAATMIQNSVEGSLVTMAENTNASSWQMLDTYLNVQDGPGYTFKIVGSTSTQTPNAFGGVNGGTIKCYAETDGGSHWNFGGASIQVTLNATATNLPTNLPDTQNRFSNLNVRYGTALSQASTTGVVATEPTKVLYLPKNSSFSVAPFKVLRNYRLTNLTEGSTTSTDSIHFDVLSENKTIAINYNFVDDKTHYVFYGPPADPVAYRIPAVAVAANGHVIAVADYRYNGMDIGFGSGEIDLVARVSKDNGATWEPRQTVIAHGNTDHTRGYGDAALVADRAQNKALLIAVTGNKTFWNATNADPMRIVRIEGNYNETTGNWDWNAPEEKTSHFYEQVYSGVTLNGMFFASGRLMQSRVVKVGEYYRVYGVIAGREQGSQTTTDNRVVFSDDFGKTWKILGGIDSRPIPSGDEAKCEEFPDGTIVVSSRMQGGRRVNVFTFGSGQDDVKNGVGTWGAPTTGITTGTNACDGELYFVNAVRKSDNSKVLLAFQSVPNHAQRHNVSVWHKEITDADKVPTSFAAGWTMSKQVSNTESAYSTMDLQKDNKFAFLWEEVGTPSIGYGGYNIAYIALSVEDLTNGAYEIDTQATTDISEVKVSNLADTVFYDLNGRRVNTLTRGKIYVTQDGKKLLVK